MPSPFSEARVLVVLSSHGWRWRRKVRPPRSRRHGRRAWRDSPSALSSNAETLGIKIGQGLAPPIEIITSDLNGPDRRVEQVRRWRLRWGRRGVLRLQGARDRTAAEGRSGSSSPHRPPRRSLEGAQESLRWRQGGRRPPVDNLLEQLDALQKIRITAFDAGVPIGPITAQIKTLREELKKAKVDAGLLIPVTPLEKVMAPFQDAIRLGEGDQEGAPGGARARQPALVAADCVSRPDHHGRHSGHEGRGQEVQG